MEIVNWIIDAILLGVHAVFSMAPPLLGLTVLSAVVGVAMLWGFGKTSNQQRMKQVKRRMQAGLLELRVFVDEPVISLRAQKSLLAANLNYLVLALRPALWMAVPVGLLLIHLASFYDRSPLPLSAPAMVTLRMSGDLAESAAPPELVVPANVQILGPPVRVTALREVSWRIVPLSPMSDKLQFRFNGRSAWISIEAGGRQRYVPGTKMASVWGSVFSPSNGRIPGDFAEWAEIRYPAARLQLFGFRVNWLVWFLAVSMASALLLKKRFAVVI